MVISNKTRTAEKNKAEVGKISVVMGIHNCADTLPDAIDSLLEQTYTNWELIMCDDASTDTTYQVALSYQEKYPDKIKLIRNNTNKFLAYSLNCCLDLATGMFIARMDGDDRSTPDRFEKQIAYLQQHPEVDLVGSAMQQFTNSGKYLRLLQPPKRPDKYRIRTTAAFNHATIMTYKRVFDALNGYVVCSRTQRCEDFDLWFRFYAQGFIGENMPEVLYLVREDREAISRRTFKNRIDVIKTARLGYSLLGFPKRWFISFAALTLGKALVPHCVVYAIGKVRK